MSEQMRLPSEREAHDLGALSKGVSQSISLPLAWVTFTKGGLIRISTAGREALERWRAEREEGR